MWRAQWILQILAREESLRHSCWEKMSKRAGLADGVPSSWLEQAKLVNDDHIIFTTKETVSVIDWSTFSKHKEKWLTYLFMVLNSNQWSMDMWEHWKFRKLMYWSCRCSNLKGLWISLANLWTTVARKWNMIWPNLLRLMAVRTQFVLRGRLSKAAINEGLKHPILLSTKYPAVVLMLKQMHENNHHEGTE